MRPKVRRRGAVLARRAFAAAAVTVVLASAGCSDDVVCPDDGATRPYVSASIVQTRGSDGERTVGTAFCTADPLPGYLVVSVNDREFADVGSGGEHGLTATLEDDDVIWPPGTACELEVATDHGIATATAVVPGGSVVAAPDSMAVGEELRLSWTRGDSADYYEVRAVLHGRSPGDSVALFAATEDTAVSIDGAAIPAAGTLRGRVLSVSGPFPEAGGEGNVTGAGFGFFTVAFSDSTGEFLTIVTSPGG